MRPTFAKVTMILALCSFGPGIGCLHVFPSSLDNSQGKWLGILAPLLGPPITISNILDNAVLETGFIVGTKLPTVSRVRVRIDNGIFEDATVTDTTWKYRLPSGASGMRFGSSHTITVCDVLCLPSLGELNLSVRKGLNKDINGDGYADVVVGADSYLVNMGMVLIYYSRGPDGIASASGSAGAAAVITGNGTGAKFGAATALGDMNGDGYADLIVGSNGSGGPGQVHIFHSAGASGIASSTYTSAKTSISGSVANSLFGWAVAVGDLNGDGYDDLITDSDTYNGGTNQGRVFIYYSAGSSGVPNGTFATANSILTGENANDHFGSALATGDVNGDGYIDLIVGAYGTSTGANQGRVYVFHSSSTGIPTLGALSANTILTGESAGDRFGTSLAVGDVNRDGYPDIVIGAYGYPANGLQGRAYVVHSRGSSGVPTGAIASIVNSTLTGGTAGDRFGSSVSTGDFNCDHYTDLIIGAPNYNGARGRAYLFHSSGASGLPGSADPSLASSIFDTTIANNFLGRTVAARDLNGDGCADPILAAPRPASFGRVHIFPSAGSSGIPGTFDITSATTTLIGQSSTDQFGTSLGGN